MRERKGVAAHDAAGNQAEQSQRSMRSAILDLRFILLSCSLLVLYAGIFIPFSFIPKYALDNGISMDFANYLLTITYGGSFIGRIGSGWLADRFGR